MEIVTGMVVGELAAELLLRREISMQRSRSIGNIRNRRSGRERITFYIGSWIFRTRGQPMAARLTSTRHGIRFSRTILPLTMKTP